MRRDPTLCQRIEEAVTRAGLAEHRGDVYLLAGASLAQRKQLHDALEPANVARRYDMEHAHAVLLGTPFRAR
jgi:hypothetical protein